MSAFCSGPHSSSHVTNKLRAIRREYCGVRYILNMASKQIIERKRSGRGFEYFYNDQRITNKDELAYFKSLGIPPAWQDVRISKHKKAKILATGLDKAGRTQAIYHPAYRARQDREKF